MLLALGAALALSMPPVASAATSGPSIRWGRALLREKPGKTGSLDAVSCAIDATGKQLCVIADETGNIWWSKTPWKRVGAWRRITIDKVRDASLTGVSCPTVSFCEVVDNQGYVIGSDDPSGGAKAWSRPVHVDTTQAPGGGFAGFAGISCASASLCVAVDNDGQVVSSANPGGGAKSWTIAPLHGSPTLTSVSCPSASLCVIAGSKRFYSTSPLRGASAWHPVGSAGGVLASLTCPSISACVGVGYGNSAVGLASATATPAGPARAWKSSVIYGRIPSGNGQLVDSVSCPETGFCVAVDGADNAFDSSSPLSGRWRAIRAARPHAASTWSAISCDYKNCVVVDSRGFLTAGTVKGVSAPSGVSPAPTTTAATPTTTTPARTTPAKTTPAKTTPAKTTSR